MPKEQLRKEIIEILKLPQVLGDKTYTHKEIADRILILFKEKKRKWNKERRRLKRTIQKWKEAYREEF